MRTLLTKIQTLGEWLSVQAVSRVSTVTCVLLFLLWSLLPLLFPNSTTVVAYVSSDVLQLVLLPLIMVGQKISSEKNKKHQDHNNQRQDRMDQLLAEMRSMILDHRNQTTLLNTIIQGQREILSDISEGEIYHNRDSEAGS
jgi:hypothetical protein